MKNIDDTPAFPSVLPPDEKKGWEAVHFEGMTLRDYFAAKALTTFKIGNLAGYYEDYAKSAYMMADAMLLERNKQK